MLIPGKPYYTYTFGSMGTTLETLRQTEFFQWFQLQEVERRMEEPGEAVRFRPSGEKFHDLCYLDVLTTQGGEMVRMELVLQREFIDGRDSLFAQDLIKSFLQAALPMACQHVLADFMREIDLPGRGGATEGFLVFKGKRNSWETFTGWSHLILTNLPSAALVVQLAPNPNAPNAKLVEWITNH
jgi:hypothetical protein